MEVLQVLNVIKKKVPPKFKEKFYCIAIRFAM